MERRIQEENELEIAKKKAWSRQPRNPTGLDRIGSVVEGGREYTYYKDSDGNYWYDSAIAVLKYDNSDKKCECWKCELSKTCNYRDRYQRLPRNRYPGALGLCKKL